MKKNYVMPQIEVIQIEIEDAVLSSSLFTTTSSEKISAEDVSSGSSWGDSSSW